MTASASTPDANSLLQFLLVVIFLGQAITALLAIINFASNRKLKREVTMDPGSVSKSEFDKHTEWNAREHDNLFKRIGGVERGGSKAIDEKIEAMRQERRRDMEALHVRVNTIAENVSGLERETEQQNQWLQRIDNKLDDLRK